MAFNEPQIHELINEETINILKINLVGILYFIIQSQINTFVDFLTSSADAHLLVTGLTDNLFNGDQGLQIQITELFKFMVDSAHEKRDDILEFFSNNLFPVFLEHYQHLQKTEKFFSFVQQYIEFLIYCVKLHGYRIKHYITQHKLLQILYKGFTLKEKSIDLALIRFVKNLVLSKDDYIIKHIANNNLMDDIFDIYLKNTRKDNLLSSACLDLFTIIQKERIKKLVIHFGTRFQGKIEEFGLRNKFQKILMDYEQYIQQDHLNGSNGHTIQGDLSIENHQLQSGVEHHQELALMYFYCLLTYF